VIEPIIHAEADLGTLIYIIIVIIWVISSAFSKSRKKKGKPPVVPREGESTAEAELREFIETMSGQKVEPTPERTPPAVRVQRVRERPRTHQHTPPPPRYVPEPEVTIDLEKVAQELLRDGAPSMAGSFSTTLSSRGSLFKMAGAALPNFRYALSSTRPRPAEPIIDRDLLARKNNLRRMVAGQIVLGPPRAFDPYTGTSEITRT